ncbi:SigE family RNA polymerase sigma factor [Antribacter sp. KLBMP9083]|uniref:SigE family RNA polymerase sigma factor n=1 Tax=Antribacter soli TaxID=2910976 RepID=A0AA41QFH3_9MICO|nr:SigE family RNA polymerase sigma factor [Antribacter soli]MCF4121212.1 SigE family RNA polymerase sigma factor [Antribacter soli]
MPPPALSADRSETPAVEVIRTGGTTVEDFTAFARAHAAGLHRIAYLLCGDDHRAHDLTQLALERTFRAWSRVGDGNPFAYARQVLATARIDGWRRTRRETTVSPDTLPGLLTEDRVRDATTGVEDRERLVRALRHVPARQRRVVVLRYLLDRSEQDVADELGISTGTVKSQGARGLARLRALLTEEDA